MNQYEDMPDSVCQKLQGLSINYALENGLIDDVGNESGNFIFKSEDDPDIIFGIVGDYKVQLSSAVTNELNSDVNEIEDLGELIFYRYFSNGKYHCRLGLPAYLNLGKTVISLKSENEQDEQVQELIESIIFNPAPKPPSNPKKGTLYFDSIINKLRCFDGSNWQNCW